MREDTEFDKDLGYLPEYKSWGSIETGMASCNWEAKGERKERCDSLGDDPNDPRIDQRVDSAGYQRWRRRQQARIRAELDGGIKEHNLHLPEGIA